MRILGIKRIMRNKEKWYMAKKAKISRFGSSANAPTPPSGKMFLLVLAAIVLLIAGFLLGGTIRKEKIKVVTENKNAVGQAFSEYGPKERDGIVPVGFEKSTGGAITAATAYVGLLPQTYLLNDGAFNVAIAKIAEPAFVSTLRDRVNVSRLKAQPIFSADPDALYREFPLGYTLISVEDEAVTVQLWSIVMLAAKPNYNGNTESIIHNIDLVWHDDDWKVSNWTTATGPTPRWQSQATPLSVEDFLDSTEPFDGGYNYVPSF